MIRLPLIALAAIMLAAGAPGPSADPLLQRLYADSRRVNDTSFGFERVTEVVQDGKRSVRVDRYDPRSPERWQLISMDGRPPTEEEVRKYQKGLVDWIVPNYGRVADLIDHTRAERVGKDRFMLHDLPPEILDKRARIFAKHVATELKVAGPPERPFVEESRVFAPEPFRVKIFAKIDNFVATSRYAPGPDGRPRIRAQNVDLSLSIMGIPRSFQSRMTYRDL